MSTRILIGDCRDVLKSLPDESVHCVVTSPRDRELNPAYAEMAKRRILGDAGMFAQVELVA